jgi:ribonucleoside-diphosphate reductase alpha chain
MTEYYIGFGRFADGSLAEVFVSCSHPTTELADTIRDASVLLSIALQYGTPLAVLRAAITRNHNEGAASLIGEVLDVLHARLAEDELKTGEQNG